METSLRRYFEEELSEIGNRKRKTGTVLECAESALGMLREVDKTERQRTYFRCCIRFISRHNGSLANYGTSMEDCFETYTEENTLRNRVRIVSGMERKKVYLEEFYKIPKAAIDETELLIQQKRQRII